MKSLIGWNEIEFLWLLKWNGDGLNEISNIFGGRVLIVALDGWTDAGMASTGAVVNHVGFCAWEAKETILNFYTDAILYFINLIRSNKDFNEPKNLKAYIITIVRNSIKRKFKK